MKNIPSERWIFFSLEIGHIGYEIRGLYIGNIRGGNISRCHLGEKNMKSGREKKGKCKRKRKKGEEKERRGKE